MAETDTRTEPRNLGVTSPPRAGTEGREGKQGGGFFQKHKKVLLIGGGGAALLLVMGNKGASANTAATDPNAQLQSQADMLAADQAAADTASTNATGTDPGATGPAGATGATGATGAKGARGKTGKGTPGKRGKTGKRGPRGKAAPKPPPDHDKKPATTHKGKAVPKSKEPAKGKPAPAKKSGKHPSTARKTPSGTKKRSPAEVEAMHGIGAGQMVMGRQFPGSIGHRMGPPERHTDGGVSRRVTIDYGGRTETHRVFGNGEQWRDREPGFNPPSRGVPALNNGHPV